jgi:iron complex transport system ATP-binding protein
MSGILKPQQGAVFLDGADISAMTPEHIARKIGYVPQTQASQFPFLIRDIVVMGRAPYLKVFQSPTALDWEIASHAINAVGISRIADKPCDCISGGEWQLCLIARALAQQPELLVLDEPTAHLDLGNQMKILDVIYRLSQSGVTVIVASHFPNHALQFAHQVAILNNRTVIRQGAPESVITEQAMRDLYGVEVKICAVNDGTERKICVPVHQAGSIDLSWMMKSKEVSLNR